VEKGYLPKDRSGGLQKRIYSSMMLLAGASLAVPMPRSEQSADRSAPARSI
jgi:hypothetical protein